jgi:hypothetical protein
MRPLQGDWITRLEENLISKQDLLAHVSIGLEAENALKTVPNESLGTLR